MTRKEIRERANERIAQEAQERHIRIQNECVEALERRELDRMHREIAAFLRSRA